MDVSEGPSLLPKNGTRPGLSGRLSWLQRSHSSSTAQASGLASFPGSLLQGLHRRGISRAPGHERSGVHGRGPIPYEQHGRRTHERRSHTPERGPAQGQFNHQGRRTGQPHPVRWQGCSRGRGGERWPQVHRGGRGDSAECRRHSVTPTSDAIGRRAGRPSAQPGNRGGP